MQWYFGGASSWFLSAGAQMSLFPYLVAVVLEEDARRVGLAQTSAMLPVLLLMLLGGATADRTDCRRLLIRLHLIAAIPPLALAGASPKSSTKLPSRSEWAVPSDAV